MAQSTARSKCIPGCPSTRALLSSHVPSPSLPGSPGGGPGPARRGATAVTLTCCRPAGDSPSPPSAPGSPAASPPSCGPHTSTCPAARPGLGDTVGMGLVKDTQPGSHGHSQPGALLGTLPSPSHPGAFSPKNVIPTKGRNQAGSAVPCHCPLHPCPPPSPTLALQNAPPVPRDSSEPILPAWGGSCRCDRSWGWG